MAVYSRMAAAILGGYVLAAAAAACLAVWLPMGRADAVTAAQMLSFVFYACGVIWVFATRNAWRAWKGILLPAAVLGVLVVAGRRRGEA
ncbi:hypothetical protein G6F59_018737 [Rhizopus arrhizus]|nr:hypothetical protein G6F59_018737 [Rhizopus arrhizus]